MEEAGQVERCAPWREAGGERWLCPLVVIVKLG